MNYTPEQLRQMRQISDLPLQTVYEDRHILATASLPGVETLRLFPEMVDKGIVFRKQYLRPDAPPLQRGETPAREYSNVTRILKLAPGLPMPTAYGHTEMIYYGEYLEGRELSIASPFPPKLEDSLNKCLPPAQGWDNYMSQLTYLYKAVQKLHAAGILHEDLHTGNILCREDGMSLIDWGSASIRPITERRLSPDYPEDCASDLKELERELLLTSYHSGIALPVQLLNELETMFPDPVLEQYGSLLAQVIGKDVPTPAIEA